MKNPFLTCEEMFDLPLNGKLNVDENSKPVHKRITHWFGNIVWFLLGLIASHIVFRHRIIGKENLRAFRKKKGCIVIANHTSYMDAFFLYISARPRQWLRIMARENLYQRDPNIVGQMFARAGSFPVSRDSADRTSLKRAVKMIKRGECVGILPEGTRRGGKGTAELSLHSGFALIARMAGDAPIVPCALVNVDKIKQKGQHVRFPKITIKFGAPILLSDFDDFEKKDRLDACAWYGMREVFAMRDGIAPERVDMKALFPNNRDFSEEFAAAPRVKHTAEELANREGWDELVAAKAVQ